MSDQQTSGSQPQTAPGTFIRGADGTLHFVPDSALSAFRVPDEHVPAAEETLNAAGAQQAPVHRGRGVAATIAQPANRDLVGNVE